MQSNHCVRSQGMMGIFRQGDPLCACGNFFICPLSLQAVRCDGEMAVAQQKEIHLCGGDLSLSYYGNSLDIAPSIHIKWTFIPPRHT